MDYGSFLKAALADDAAGVARHIAAGLSPNRPIPDGQGGTLTILHLAAFKGHVAATSALLDGGADPDLFDSSDEPAMKTAIIAGRRRIVERLLDAGADVNVRMAGGETPLHVALTAEESDIAQLLMDRGADPDLANDRGITPRHIRGFKAMKRGGWDTSKPNSGAAFRNNLGGMSDEGLEAFFQMLPFMIRSRVASGQITPAREIALNALIRDFEQARKLPLELRSKQMRAIAQKIRDDLGLPQAYR